MTIEEDFFAAATAGSPSLRLYPEVLPTSGDPGNILPAGTYTMVGGSDDMHLTGKANTGERVFQLDAWAYTRLGADSLLADFEARLLAASSFGVVGIDVTPLTHFERYEPDTKRYRASKEYTIRFD